MVAVITIAWFAVVGTWLIALSGPRPKQLVK